MKLKAAYLDGFVVEVEGCDMAAFERSSLWKVRLSTVRKLSCGTAGQLVLFPADLTTADVNNALNKLRAVSNVVSDLEIEIDESIEDARQSRDAGICGKASAGAAIKGRLPQVKAEFLEFSGVVNSIMARPLRERQMWDAFFMCSMSKSANFSVPGSGKTAATLGAFGYLRYVRRVDRLIVVGPKSSFGSWRDEWISCFGTQYPLRVLDFHDSSWSGKGKKARRRELTLNASRYDLILLNYEMLASVAQEVHDLAADQAMLVFDEVHKVKQIGGKRASAALEVASDARNVVALTGTPIPNSFCDVYNLLHLLYPHEYDSYFGYSPEFLASLRSQEGAQVVNRKLQPFFCRTSKKDLQVPDASPDIICNVRASYAEQQLLELVKREYRRTPLVLIVRVMQLQSDPRLLQTELATDDLAGLFDADTSSMAELSGAAPALSDPYAKRLIEQACPSSKFKECIRIVEELVRAGKPAVVWCFFRGSMLAVAQALVRKGISCGVVYGATEAEERQRTLDAFKAGGLRVLVTNPQTLAESVSLHTVCHDAVYFEYGYNLVHLLQSKDRIHRLGLPPGQYTQYRFIRLTYELDDEDWSLDQNIYDRLMEKEQRMLDAMDRGVLEAGSMDESDLAKVFSGLFDVSSAEE